MEKVAIAYVGEPTIENLKNRIIFSFGKRAGSDVADRCASELIFTEDAQEICDIAQKYGYFPEGVKTVLINCFGVTFKE